LKVTIDSTEPLADALRVVGALYNVTVTQVDEAPALGTPTGSARTSRRARAASNGSSRRTATRKATGRSEAPTAKRSSLKAAAASTSDIRKWALTHGHAVSSQGPLPAAVKIAYAEAHKG
jgi:hypothetical protein